MIWVRRLIGVSGMFGDLGFCLLGLFITGVSGTFCLLVGLEVVDTGICLFSTLCIFGVGMDA